MRLTIARKIALAVTAIVILSIGTMAWVTSSNLRSGFISYLNEMQTQDLDQLRMLLEERYRQEGNFEWLRRQPRALRDVLDQMKPRILVEPDGQGARRLGADAPPPQDDLPPQADAPPRADPPPQAYPPPRNLDGRRPPNPYGRPAPGAYGRPPPDAYGRPPPRADGEPPPDPQDARPPRAEPPPPRAPAPPDRRDPMGFASRISIVDAQGRVLIGPPDFPPGIERDIKVDGQVVGRMRLLPLRQASGADASAGIFLREQLRTIALLSCALVSLAILAAIWLARHLLRPVAALRTVTARLARGEFDARAPLLSRDELAELALHVNEMAQALEESERQRRKILADISHELRTPLTVIRGEIEALLDGIRQADAQALDSLHAEVLRLNKLVDDLHQLTLADAGDMQFHWQRLDLIALLRPLLERYQPRAAKARLDLSWSLPSLPIMLEADADRLTQIVINLLENSVRYSDAGGQIVVAMSLTGLYVELTVEDSAPGVPHDAYASIFERLYRVDAARTRGGSGLGLAICKALAEAHGGSIKALPSVLGGIKILLRLPLNHSRSRKS